MKKVTVHLSGNAYAVLQACPGQTDGDRVRWLVDYFGQVLDARAKQKQVEKKPALIQLVASAGEEIASEPGSVESSVALIGGQQ